MEINRNRMGEQTHAEMQSEHYKALRTNPFYYAEFMLDVLREELMMTMPRAYTQEAMPIQLEPREFSSREWAELSQTRGRLIHLERKVISLLEEMRALQGQKPMHYK